MALSMQYHSLQLLVENRLPRTRTGTSQLASRGTVDGFALLPNRNLDKRIVPVRKGLLHASHKNEWNSTSNTEESRFVPSAGGAQRRKLVSSLDFGVKASTVGQSSGSDDVGEVGSTVTAVSEIKEKTWLQNALPEGLWPYAQLARVDRPVGSWLLAWPCFWSICLATPPGQIPDLKIAALLGLWSIVMRGAACTVNDMLDRDFDALVERTQSRPFPSGSVSLFQGIAFLGFQFLLGIALLSPLNATSQILGAAFAPLSCIYPLMKRVTYWPQAFLGVFFSVGAPLGWAAVNDNASLSAILPLFGFGVCWQIVIDTIYAHQDKDFDREIGVKSTALLFGDNTPAILGVFGVSGVAMLALTGYNCGLGWPYYAGVVAAGAHLAWQIFAVDLDDPEDCGYKFRTNQWYGALVCGAIILGNLTMTHA